jgi:hypothetical protein
VRLVNSMLANQAEQAQDYDRAVVEHESGP